jgi:hypothetical protein
LQMLQAPPYGPCTLELAHAGATDGSDTNLPLSPPITLWHISSWYATKHPWDGNIYLTVDSQNNGPYSKTDTSHDILTQFWINSAMQRGPSS